MFSIFFLPPGGWVFRQVLQHGDETAIGDRGINLSGEGVARPVESILKSVNEETNLVSLCLKNLVSLEFVNLECLIRNVLRNAPFISRLFKECSKLKGLRLWTVWLQRLRWSKAASRTGPRSLCESCLGQRNAEMQLTNSNDTWNRYENGMECLNERQLWMFFVYFDSAIPVFSLNSWNTLTASSI